jgi:hypothetical protein
MSKVDLSPNAERSRLCAWPRFIRRNFAPNNRQHEATRIVRVIRHADSNPHDWPFDASLLYTELVKKCRLTKARHVRASAKASCHGSRRQDNFHDPLFCFLPCAPAYNGRMTPARPPITDSPWFWAYLFSLAALLALALVGPKYSRRQSQIERQFEGRQAAVARTAAPADGKQAAAPTTARRELLVSLRPLWLGLAGVTTVAWIVFWRSRSHEVQAPDFSSGSSSHGTDV